MNQKTLHIRPATVADAAELLAIYRPFVEETAVSFETVVPEVKEFSKRISRSLRDWAWLVAEADGQCLGYAYGCAHRARPAYRLSVETSAYVRGDQQRRGVARALYDRLFEALRTLGYCNAYAGITLPNAASVAFHRSMGFRDIGIFSRVGYKFGQWHDVGWYHRVLRDNPLHGDVPKPP